MHCPLASGLGMNIFPASLLLAEFLHILILNLEPKWLTERLLCNFVTMILAARDLNQH